MAVKHGGLRGKWPAPYVDKKASFKGNLNTDSYLDGIIHKLKHLFLLNYFSATFVPLHASQFYILRL